MKQVPDATLTRITELLRTLNSGAFTVKPGAFTDLVAELDAIQNPQPTKTVSILTQMGTVTVAG